MSVYDIYHLIKRKKLNMAGSKLFYFLRLMKTVLMVIVRMIKMMTKVPIKETMPSHGLQIIHTMNKG